MSGASPWIEAGIVVVVVASLPLAIRWGRKHARGRAGGVAMMLGLAFGSLFDPAKAAATETLAKRRESGKQEAEASEGMPPGT